MVTPSSQPAVPVPAVIDWSFYDYYVPEPELPVMARRKGLLARWRQRRT